MEILVAGMVAFSVNQYNCVMIALGVWALFMFF